MTGRPVQRPWRGIMTGIGKRRLLLAPGRYQYKFIVDGDWIADPTAQNNVPNEHGSLNLVVEV